LYQKLFNDLLQSNGIVPDRITERANQICYLPNKGEFYDYKINKTEKLLNAKDFFNESYHQLKQDLENQRLAELGVMEKSNQKAIQRIATGQVSPIQAFNESYPLDSLLRKYGYKKVGRKWLSPNSQTGKAGVTIKGNKWFSSHGSDANLGIGQNKNGSCFGDGFDLVKFYEYGNDRDTAIKKISDEFQINGKTITQNNRINYREKQDHKSIGMNELPEPPTEYEYTNQYPKKQGNSPKKESTKEKLNKEIALLIIEGKSKIVKLKDLSFWDKQAAIDWYAHQLAYDKKGKKIGKNTSYGFKHYTAFADWLVWKDRKRFDGIVFDPSEKHNSSKLNIYKGMSIIPKQGDCQLILDHIFTIWCNEHQPTYDYVINWFARMIQKPHLQAETALTLNSGQGTGKNIILDIFTNIFKEHSTVSTQLSDIAGDFNDHLATSIFVFLNEALWAGDKKAEGIIKALITDETITMHKKFMPRVKIKNCTHLVICSNNEWYAALGLDDRRYVTLIPSEKKKGDFTYFEKLANQIEKGGQAAFLHHLQQRDISNFKPRILPETSEEIKSERGRTKLLNADPVPKWAVDFLDSGGMEINQFNNANWLNNFIEVRKKDLIECYKNYCKDRNLYVGTDKAFYQKVRKLFNLKTTRSMIEKIQLRCFTFPKLEKCKESLIFSFEGDSPLDKYYKSIT
jgi:hypothetical protein